MSDTPVFQGHHVIEQQTLKNSALLRALEKQGLYDMDSPRNLLNLPADRELAADLSLSPHPGGPLGQYKKGVLRELNELQSTKDGQAALNGDLDAAKRVAAKVLELEDTMKAGLVNNDLVSNTPKGMTPEAANEKIKDFFGNIDEYKQAHAAQIDALGKMKPEEAMWAGVAKSEANVEAALDAIGKPGMKAAKGDAAAGRASFETGIEQAQKSGRLTLSDPVQAKLHGTAAGPQGTTPESKGSAPEPQGAAPESKGAPELPGTTPEPKGTAPDPKGSTPELKGTTPELPAGELPGSGIKGAELPPVGSSPELVPKGASGVGLAAKGVEGVGVALLAYDFVTTGNRMMTLQAQGNAVGAESAGTHFIGRNAGGLFGSMGGIGAGFVYGAIAGSETGPGALATGVVGGIAGAFLGEKWADQRDREKVFTQTDRDGNAWTRDPDDPKGTWTRSIEMPTADGGYRETQASAAGRLVDELNYQSANASYGLGLANPPAPQNPFSLPGNASDPSGFTQSNWTRDAQTGGWSRIVMDRPPLSEFDPGETHTEQASAQRTKELDAQASMVIAQNAANTPAAIAARYEIAYDEFKWKDFGPKSDAVTYAATQTQTLQASDGNTYTHNANGEWTTPGLLYGTNTATGNIREELNRTLQSEQAGLQKMAAIAKLAEEQPKPTELSMRSQVESAYARAGIVRSEAQIDAATAAVTRNQARDHIESNFTLQVRPDQSIATLVGHDDGRMEVKSVATAQDIAQAQKQTAAPGRAESPQAQPPAQPPSQPHHSQPQPPHHTPSRPHHAEPSPHHTHARPHHTHARPHHAEPSPYHAQPHPSSDSQPHPQPNHIDPVRLVPKYRNRELEGREDTHKSGDEIRAAESTDGKTTAAAYGKGVDTPAGLRPEEAQVATNAQTAKPGNEKTNPWEQTAAGQFMEKYFAACQRGDEASATRLADAYAQSTQYQTWQQWGQNHLQQQESEQQRQVAQTSQSGQGRGI